MFHFLSKIYSILTCLTMTNPKYFIQWEFWKIYRRQGFSQRFSSLPSNFSNHALSKNFDSPHCFPFFLSLLGYIFHFRHQVGKIQSKSRGTKNGDMFSMWNYDGKITYDYMKTSLKSQRTSTLDIILELAVMVVFTERNCLAAKWTLARVQYLYISMSP